MRVCLISPPYGDAGESMRPIGLMAIQTYLEAELGDAAQIELIDVSDCAADDFSAIELFAVDRADVIGLCAYSTNFLIVRSWAVELKRRNPGLVIVVGGPHATALPKHIAAVHADAFDYVVRGEGERPMTAIVRSLLEASGRRANAPGIAFRGPLGVVGGDTTDPVPDLDLVPPPMATLLSPYERTMIYFDRKEGRPRRAVALTTSRGCPFTCSFCSIRASSSKWRAVSAARLGDWIAKALEIEGPDVEHVYFMDADFLINKKRVLEIGEMISTRFPRLTWSFSGRVDDLARLGEPAVATLTTQGLRAIEMGIESGSQVVLDRLNKKVTVQENYDAVAMLKRHDLELIIDFIMFIPDETPEQLRESLTFARNAGLSEHFPSDHFFSYLLLYPATPLRTEYGALFGREFSPDVLPEPDDLFTDPRTKQIFKAFIRDFRPYRKRLSTLVPMVERAALDLATSQPELAQWLRIEVVSLKHVAVLVLEGLIDHPEAGSLLEAVPWLARFDDHSDHLERLCGQRPRSAAA